MKTHIAVLAVLSLAGCAANEPQQLAKADCKVAPITTRSAVNKAGPVSELDRRYAEAQLRSSGFRQHELARMGEAGTIEQALRDCP